jgi:aminoglycoside phosphotransferase family enzyme
MMSVVESLLRPAALPGCAQAARLIETHISWVLLAGETAYKIKKPVDLGFLDYSTLALRKHFCEEELRVNRRYAPQIYLDVVAVTAGAAGAEIDGSGRVLDYAVRMRRFPDDALLSDAAARGLVDVALWRQLGVDIAAVHAVLPLAGPEHEDGRGTPLQLRDAVNQNFRQTRPYLRDGADLALLNRLEEQAWAACQTCERTLWQRYENGLVRECHGDLHLGNIVLLDGRAVAFDAIEFNPALSWIDVMNELAFLVMDCESRGCGAAWIRRAERLARAHWGDYAGLALLDFFCAYRAMVRAKVSALGAGRPPLAEGSARASRVAGAIWRWPSATPCRAGRSSRSPAASRVRASRRWRRRWPAARVRSGCARTWSASVCSGWRHRPTAATMVGDGHLHPRGEPAHLRAAGGTGARGHWQWLAGDRRCDLHPARAPRWISAASRANSAYRFPHPVLRGAARRAGAACACAQCSARAIPRRRTSRCSPRSSPARNFPMPPRSPETLRVPGGGQALGARTARAHRGGCTAAVLTGIKDRAPRAADIER